MNIKIGFTESSKAVTAHVQIESDVTTQEQQLELLQQAQTLYLKAQDFSYRETMKKIR